MAPNFRGLSRAASCAPRLPAPPKLRSSLRQMLTQSVSLRSIPAAEKDGPVFDSSCSTPESYGMAPEDSFVLRALSTAKLLVSATGGPLRGCPSRGAPDEIPVPRVLPPSIKQNDRVHDDMRQFEADVVSEPVRFKLCIERRRSWLAEATELQNLEDMRVRSSAQQAAPAQFAPSPSYAVDDGAAAGVLLGGLRRSAAGLPRRCSDDAGAADALSPPSRGGWLPRPRVHDPWPSSWLRNSESEDWLYDPNDDVYFHVLSQTWWCEDCQDVADTIGSRRQLRLRPIALADLLNGDKAIGRTFTDASTSASMPRSASSTSS